jgi:hypothetical protein
MSSPRERKGFAAIAGKPERYGLNRHNGSWSCVGAASDGR